VRRPSTNLVCQLSVHTPEGAYLPSTSPAIRLSYKKRMLQGANRLWSWAPAIPGSMKASSLVLLQFMVSQKLLLENLISLTGLCSCTNTVFKSVYGPKGFAFMGTKEKAGHGCKVFSKYQHGGGVQAHMLESRWAKTVPADMRSITDWELELF